MGTSFFRFRYFAITLLVFSLFSCKKDFSELGLSVQPEEDIINGLFTDTSKINCFTEVEDSLSTDERSAALLGIINDPVFGTSTASFMAQLRLTSANIVFGSNLSADSIVLYLDYKSFYGDTTIPQTIEAYELNQSIYIDSSYYSNLDASLFCDQSQLLGTLTYDPCPNDTVLIFKLDNSFAQKLLFTDTANYVDNDAFLDFFKGIYIKPAATSNPGSIIYFDLLSTRTQLIMYYHADTVADSISYVFNENSARINLFHHDFTTGSISNLGDSLVNDSFAYIQAMSGTKMKLYFPGLPKWNDSIRYAIAKAELVIPVDTSDYYFSAAKPPESLLLVTQDADGSYAFTEDYYIGTAYFGGSYDEDNHTYTFNVSRYVQGLIDGTTTDYGLTIMAGDNRVTANRARILNFTHTQGMRLNITYLKL